VGNSANIILKGMPAEVQAKDYGDIAREGLLRQHIRGQNMLDSRTMAAQDAAANRLSGQQAIRQQNVDPNTGKLNQEGYRKSLELGGYGAEADAAGEDQQAKLIKHMDTNIKFMGFVQEGLKQALANPAAYPQVYQTANELHRQINGDDAPPLTIPETFDGPTIQGVIEASIPAADKLKMQHEQLKQQYAQSKDQQTQQNWQQTYDSSQENQQLNRDVQMRGQDSAAADRQLNYQQRQDAIEATRINKRMLPAKQIESLNNAQAGLENAARLTNTFNDSFGGHQVTGGLSNTAGRLMGDETGQAQWWQDYQTHKNAQRNALFGGALTPTEQAEYEKQDITPRMDAKQIKANLARQEAIAKRGYERLQQNYNKAGYDTQNFNLPEAPLYDDEDSKDPEFEVFMKEKGAR
jgi:hypothetical protein